MSGDSTGDGDPYLTWDLDERESQRLRVFLARATKRMLMRRLALPVGVGVIVSVLGAFHQWRIGVEVHYAAQFGFRILLAVLCVAAFALAFWWVATWRVRRLNKTAKLSIEFGQRTIRVGAQHVNLLFWAHKRRFRLLQQEGHNTLLMELEYKESLGTARAKKELMIPIPAGREKDIDRLRQWYGRGFVSHAEV